MKLITAIPAFLLAALTPSVAGQDLLGFVQRPSCYYALNIPPSPPLSTKPQPSTATLYSILQTDFILHYATGWYN
jgi:hypothetical protein